METALRFFLPLFVLAYVGLTFFWRTFRVWRSAGVNPYRLGNADTAHDFIGRHLRLALALGAAVVLVYSFLPGLYPYLLPARWLQHPALAVTGVGLMLASLVWVLVAQAQMGNAWRIGIDSTHATELVQGGLFQRSRNPIFLGMRVTLLGLFLALPNAPTLLILVLGDALMQIQVRLEEDHLGRLHGERYRDYCRRVRRWW
jgi:protein-S-isoprenylcysteine O-methyltransferase Ste14